MKKVRVYWVEALRGDGSHYKYWCLVDDGNGREIASLFSEVDRDEFFRRYNALIVEKEAGPDSDKRGVADG